MVSGWLLILFAFSITPKIYLHDVIATHKDSSFNISEKATQVSKKGIHCDCNSLVVISPFLSESNSVQLTPLSFFVDNNCKVNKCFYSVDVYVSSLRGPPLS